MKLNMGNAITACGLIFGIFISSSVFASNQCARIKDGLIVDKEGNVLTTGYDKWGYNYQAHTFNGLYGNYSRPDEPVTEGKIHLQMKWSDDWLSNKDCDYSGTLDRGGDGDDIGSKGWLTNHEEGSYIDEAGEEQFYTYFVKIVYLENIEECPENNQIWGSYCIVQEVMNDPAAGMNGKAARESIQNVGLGHY